MLTIPLCPKFWLAIKPVECSQLLMTLLLGRTATMNINCKKTKEMICGPLRKQPPPLLLISNKNVEQVTSFKLLGVTINNSLKWDDHIAAVTSKAAKRLWFLKKLKRAGVSQADLIYLLLSSCYQTCTRICVPCFAYKHYRSAVEEIGLNLSNYSSRQANDACTLLGLSSLHERRQEQCQKLFQQLACSTDNCLFALLTAGHACSHYHQ